MTASSRFDVILFDIDNVLVDTRQSYLAAIRETVSRYLGRPDAVIPAKAGIQRPPHRQDACATGWIPAFACLPRGRRRQAGMTEDP